MAGSDWRRSGNRNSRIAKVDWMLKREVEREPAIFGWRVGHLSF